MVWRNIDAIIPNKLYLGNLQAACSTRSLQERRITHIVSVCKDKIPAQLSASGITHMRIPVDDVDYADLLIHFPSACQFIHNAISNGGVVLVHCVEGISRSAAVVAAYLMWSRRIRSTDALDIVRQARELAWPNAGFHEQLVLFEVCGYNPSPAGGPYMMWRANLDHQLRAAGLR